MSTTQPQPQAQSWAEWLLDAYASSVSPNPSEPAADDEDTTDGSNYDPTSPVSQQSSTFSSSSSPYGPYVKTGRGGAGNFAWQSIQPIKTPSDDLEAQKPSTLSARRKAAANIEHLDTGAAMRSKATQRSVSQYIRVGRGFVQSNEVQQSPRSVSTPIDALYTPTSATPTSAVHPGRGGAGNFAAAAAVKEKAESEREAKERIEAERKRQLITEEVESKLMPPPDAWLGGRRKSMNIPEPDML